MGFVASVQWSAFGEEAGKADGEEEHPGRPHLFKVLDCK